MEDHLQDSQRGWDRGQYTENFFGDSWSRFPLYVWQRTYDTVEKSLIKVEMDDVFFQTYCMSVRMTFFLFYRNYFYHITYILVKKWRNTLKIPFKSTNTHQLLSYDPDPPWVFFVKFV